MAEWLIPIPPWPKPAAAEDCDIVLFIVIYAGMEWKPPLQNSNKILNVLICHSPTSFSLNYRVLKYFLQVIKYNREMLQ